MIRSQIGIYVEFFSKVGKENSGRLCPYILVTFEPFTRKWTEIVYVRNGIDFLNTHSDYLE